ncbi:MAG: lytic transglycosylase domain-containing protein [Alphaproteobacteria bacterium]|nr:lytic transglycosylase domain-containing protein [Alphaproteobacteria bacterium]
MARCRAIAALLVLLVSPAQAVSDRKSFANAVCSETELQAQVNKLDPSFFARLLWRESLFDPNVVSSKGAQGIAQFMPETAERRGLNDPFDPLSAVKAAASFLAELRNQFGNLGLAAAAYNAGEFRVENWQNGKASMPEETQVYVQFITGHTVEEWKSASSSFAIPAIGQSPEFLTNCVALALQKTQLAGTPMRSAPRQPWGALVAASFSEHTAISMFQRLKLRYPQHFANREPMISRKKILSRGTRSMAFVMLGEKTVEAARRTCGALNAAGASCIVRRN